MASNAKIRPIKWQENELLLLDQRLLPHSQEWLRLTTAPAVAKAITELMVVRHYQVLMYRPAPARISRLKFVEQKILTHFSDCIIKPSVEAAWNPVFDITPAAWVDVLVTEQGVLQQPGEDSISELFCAS